MAARKPRRTRGKAPNRSAAAPSPKVKVAIIGGGCAGIAAAWQLSQPKYRETYEVTVYEKSWRLGGKGASGRTAEGRIHEHGLHVWLGFYENAFRMIRECYKEAGTKYGPDKGEGYKLAHGSFEDAFFPELHLGVAIPYASDDDDRYRRNDWFFWSGLLPPAEGLPGDDLDEQTNPFTLWNYLARCFELLKALMLSVIGRADDPEAGKPRPNRRSTLDEAIELDFSFDPARSPAAVVEMISRYLRTGILTSAAGLLQTITFLEVWVRKMNFAPQVADSALELIEAVAAQSRKQLRDLVAVDPHLRWKTEIIDIVLTIAVGLYRDRVLFDDAGLDAINHIDYRQWLLQHGATRSAVDSRFITGIYDLTFAYRDGDRKKPALAAGVALRGALRMFFTYRGSMFWRMRSGMGDTVFAPLYRVLLDRGVQFRFLHELSDVELKDDNGERYVTRLTFTTCGEASKLGKLGHAALDHFGCWPSDDHLLSTVAGSQVDTNVLYARPSSNGADEFDAVVFAMGPDDFIAAFGGSMPADLGGMCDHVNTVATQAAQVWLDSDLEELGWRRGPGVITAFEPPFETWADMTHTFQSEAQWRTAKGQPAGPDDKVRSIAYFCGTLPEKEIAGLRQRSPAGGRRRKPAGAAAESQPVASRSSLAEGDDGKVGKLVRDNVEGLLSVGLKPLWPAAFRGKSSARSRMIGEFHAQANFKGSERYTLSLPGTIRFRISPLDRTIANMSVAGDWTATGIDAGCVESAVISGMLAAFAITNDEPAPEKIVGYDHP